MTSSGPGLFYNLFSLLFSPRVFSPFSQTPSFFNQSSLWKPWDLTQTRPWLRQPQSPARWEGRQNALFDLNSHRISVSKIRLELPSSTANTMSLFGLDFYKQRINLNMTWSGSSEPTARLGEWQNVACSGDSQHMSPMRATKEPDSLLWWFTGPHVGVPQQWHHWCLRPLRMEEWKASLKSLPPKKINKQNKQKRIWNTPRLKTGKSDFPFTETVRLFKGWELRISRGRNGVFYFRNAQKPMKRGGPLDAQPLVTAGARTMAPESSTLHWQCFLQKMQNQATHQGHHWLETKITFHWTKEIVQSLPANTKNRKPWLQSSKPWF